MLHNDRSNHNQLPDVELLSKIFDPSTSDEERKKLFYIVNPSNGLDIFCRLLIAGQSENVERLVQLGYQVNHEDLFGRNTLMKILRLPQAILGVKLKPIVLYLLNEGVDYNAINRFGYSAADLLKLRFKLEIRHNNNSFILVDVPKEKISTKIRGFEWPFLIQFEELANALLTKPFQFIQQKRFVINSATSMIKPIEYLFGFIKIADYKLVEKLLDYLLWLDGAERDIGHPSGVKAAILNTLFKGEKPITYAIKVRQNDPEIVALLIQKGASTEIKTGRVEQEVRLQILATNPVPYVRHRCNLLNMQSGLIRGKWAKYVLVDKKPEEESIGK